jgi:hypothetical protein
LLARGRPCRREISGINTISSLVDLSLSIFLRGGSPSTLPHPIGRQVGIRYLLALPYFRMSGSPRRSTKKNLEGALSCLCKLWLGFSALDLAPLTWVRWTRSTFASVALFLCGLSLGRVAIPGLLLRLRGFDAAIESVGALGLGRKLVNLGTLEVIFVTELGH